MTTALDGQPPEQAVVDAGARRRRGAHRAKRPGNGAGRRASLVTVDQMLSSASNLLALVWVAHVASAADFGGFSLIMLVYTFVIGLVHALISMRVAVHPEDADHRPRQVLGSALLIGTGGGLFFAVVGAVQTVAGSSIGPAMLVLGLLLPFLTLHDVGRWMGVARHTPGRAIVLDTLWLLYLLVGFVAITVLHDAGLFTLTLAWTGSGAVASLTVLVQYGAIRRGELTLGWLREGWDQSWRLMVGNITAAGSAVLGASLIAFAGKPVAVAAVRGAIFLGRPTQAIQIAVASSVAVDVAREKPDNRGLWRHQHRAMAVSLAVALVNVAVLVVLPDWLGRAVLGNVWPVLAGLTIPVSLWLVLTAAQSGVPPVLIGRHQFQVAMVVQIVAGLLNVTALVTGAAVGNVSGAVWGLVVGQGATAACWWGGLAWYLRHGERAAVPALS